MRRDKNAAAETEKTGLGALAPTAQTTTWGWSRGVKRGGVSQEEGHATQVIQLKVYRPARPEISASVNEKFYHNVKN